VIERLYKYCPYINGLKIIESHSLLFTNPREFNDPFEFDINLLKFDFNEASEEIKYELAFIKNEFSNKYGKDILQEIDNIINNKVEDHYKNSQLSKVSRSSVCCFSKKNSNIVLWSHYADKHKGICLIFDLTDSPVFENHKNYSISQGPVRYIDYKSYQPINYLKDRLSAISSLLYTKSLDWEYEKEYRYHILDNSGLIAFKNSFLKGAIFGLRVNEKERNYFINKANELGHNKLEFYIVNKNHLNISIDEIQH
jgi:hypothetical protein